MCIVTNVGTNDICISMLIAKCLTLEKMEYLDLSKKGWKRKGQNAPAGNRGVIHGDDHSNVCFYNKIYDNVFFTNFVG